MRKNNFKKELNLKEEYLIHCKAINFLNNNVISCDNESKLQYNRYINIFIKETTRYNENLIPYYYHIYKNKPFLYHLFFDKEEDEPRHLAFSNFAELKEQYSSRLNDRHQYQPVNKVPKILTETIKTEYGNFYIKIKPKYFLTSTSFKLKDPLSIFFDCLPNKKTFENKGFVLLFEFTIEKLFNANDFLIFDITDNNSSINDEIDDIYSDNESESESEKEEKIIINENIINKNITEENIVNKNISNEKIIINETIADENILNKNISNKNKHIKNTKLSYHFVITYNINYAGIDEINKLIYHLYNNNEKFNLFMNDYKQIVITKGIHYDYKNIGKHITCYLVNNDDIKTNKYHFYINNDNKIDKITKIENIL